MNALAIDLFCGLGGWAEGFLAEGYSVVGFDNERRPYPGHLVLQDVTTLHGSQFKDAAVIVASPPCQAYSYRAMPIIRARDGLKVGSWFDGKSIMSTTSSRSAARKHASALIAKIPFPLAQHIARVYRPRD